jgi:hypothetical protein
MQVNYDYSDVPTVRKFARSSSFIRGLMGPFGSGKSSGCVVETWRRAAAQEPDSDGKRRTRFAIVRNTYPQLNDTTIRTFFDWFPPGTFGHYVQNSHDYHLKFNDIECLVQFRALDRPDHVSNLLSLELTGAWCNEAREIPWEIVRVLQGRVNRYPRRDRGGPTWSGIFMDTNPPDSDSWWYELFEERRIPGTQQKVEGDVELFRQPSGRGPHAENLTHLPEDYYERMMGTMPDEEIKVYVDGEYGFLQTGRAVYPEYKDAIHCKHVLPVAGKPIIRGWDFGLTPACELAQFVNGQIRFLDELVSDRAGIEQFSQVVVKHCAEMYPTAEFEDIGDPSGAYGRDTDERSAFDILETAANIDCQGYEEDQDPTIRVESVKHGLSTLIDGEPGLVVDPKCLRLRKGFQGAYKYRRIAVSGVARYADKPDKGMYSHPHDAAQYVAARLLGDLIRGLRSDQNRQTSTNSHYDPYARQSPSQRQRQASAENFYDPYEGSR